MAKITPLIENTAMRFGLIPIEIDFEKEEHRWFLRVFLFAHDRGVTLDDCENVTRSLNDFLDEVNIMDINQSHLTIYAEIDAYSQRLNPNFETYPFDTPRNMGKNDLWIASLAALLSLKLITTDSDFDHLHNVFFEVKKIKPEEFVQFF